MIDNPTQQKEAADKICEYANIGLKNAYGAEENTQEPEILAAILHTIAGGLSGQQVAGLTWNPMILPSKGKGAAEKEFGADALIVLDISERSRFIRKGLLVQAKMKGRRDNRLEGQCKKMLRVTSESYVWTLSQDGVTVESASQRLPNPIGPSTKWSLCSFILAFLACKHGDHQFRAATLGELARVRNKANADFALLLKAES